jgi:hypothetical protein
MRLSLIVFLLFLIFPNHSYADQPRNQKVDWVKLGAAWENYMDYPSSENADKVYNLLPAQGHFNYTHEHQEEDETSELIYSNLKMLERQIYSSDRHAVKLGFRLFTIADGGFAEYLDDILGSLIRINPRLFLEELKENRDIIMGLDGLLGNFGDPYVDRMKAHDLEASLRVKALRSVKDKSLKSLRDECIRTLEKDSSN